MIYITSVKKTLRVRLY